MANNRYLNALKAESNFTLTTNGGLAHKTSGEALYDLFSLGGAYRQRSEDDCIFLFQKAFDEDPVYALKCLFYLRDVRGGQGERRFFRIVTKWLANNRTEAMKRNLQYVPEFGRYDDWYVFVGTKLEKDMFELMRKQIILDMECKTPSLLAKWLKSENTSSAESCRLGDKTCIAFGMSHKQYRKTLSILRKHINVLERLMSEKRWDEIEFDKIPSKAGLVYKNAFARHDVERMKAQVEIQSYADFVRDDTKKVNTKALYPYEIVAKAFNLTYNGGWSSRAKTPDETERAAVNKFWANYGEELANLNLNALCVIDTSGSMWGREASAPINMAIALGMMAAEKAKGPFHGTFVSFSSRPQVIDIEGIDFVDKVRRIYQRNLCENTNLEATFDMLLRTAINNRVPAKDMPGSIIVISDMQIDSSYGLGVNAHNRTRTMMEGMREKWSGNGYKLPQLVYWNVNASKDTFLDDGPNVSYVSGSIAVLFEQIAKGITAMDLMYDKLNIERYAVIH